LALAKPPSVLRERVDDMREEKVGLDTQQMTALTNIYLIRKRYKEKKYIAVIKTILRVESS
jgi:hypothetical protein